MPSRIQVLSFEQFLISVGTLLQSARFVNAILNKAAQDFDSSLDVFNGIPRETQTQRIGITSVWHTHAGRHKVHPVLAGNTKQRHGLDVLGQCEPDRESAIRLMEAAA